MNRRVPALWFSQAARAAALVAVVVAGCQPLPQPFSHAGQPDRALLALPDHGGIIVLPVSDAPPATADALASAMVEALHAANVPASRGGGNRDSAFLQGRVEDNGRDARVVWDLHAGDGTLIGSAPLTIEGTPIAQWAAAEPALMTRLAATSVAAIAALIQDDAPVEVAAPRIVVLPIEGAPGDGDVRLGEAVRTALTAVEIEVADAVAAVNDGRTLSLAGRVDIAEAGAAGQAVEISWTVLDPAGRQLGVIRQANLVPAGSLDGGWDEVAEAVAAGTAEGVADLLTRIEWRPNEPAATAR